MTFDFLPRLAQLCAEINPKPTNQSITGYNPTVFLEFSGHVNLVTVSIFENGWISGSDPNFVYRIYPYLDIVDGFMENSVPIVCDLDSVFSHLEKIKETFI